MNQNVFGFRDLLGSKQFLRLFQKYSQDQCLTNYLHGRCYQLTAESIGKIVCSVKLRQNCQLQTKCPDCLLVLSRCCCCWSCCCCFCSCFCCCPCFYYRPCGSGDRSSSSSSRIKMNQQNQPPPCLNFVFRCLLGPSVNC